MTKPGWRVVTSEAHGLPTILVVDDERRVMEVICKVLRKEGFRCIGAKSSAKAIELCDRGQPFDLVVCDVVMPEMSGPKLGRALLKSRPDLHLIFITGNAHKFDELTAAGLHCIQKPFPFEQLTAAVRGVIGQMSK
jgi:two-component system cell cycle sensor histidine kinase/response regulator CckA